MDYFSHSRAPTGIQRVQLNVIAHALEAPGEGVRTAVVAFDPGRGFWREIPRPLFRRLWELSRTGADHRAPDWEAARHAALRAVAEGADHPFPPGSWLVNLGTSWWIKDYFARVRQLQRHAGVRYLPFVHDCIPLIVPDHCTEALVREFRHWFGAMALQADGLLVNSACTGRDVRRMIAGIAPDLELPVAVIPLDADMRSELPAPRRKPPRPAGLPPPGAPFALFVGTVESRKNHVLVFRAWLELMRRHGERRIPHLVCVGKHGWLAEPTLALYRTAPALRRRVSIVHGIPDTVLAGLYESCLFTVYNSHYEGWGLPLTESLSYGKVAVAPDHSSLPESGGEGAVFFRHLDQEDLVRQLERMILEPGFRAARERRLREKVRLRGWGEIKDQVLAEARRIAAAPPPPPEARLRLTPGRAYDMRLAAGGLPDAGLALADAMRDGPGWHLPEGWGVWSRPGRARLRLPLPAPGRWRVALDLVLPPGGLAFGLRAVPEGGAAPAFHEVRGAGGARLRAELEALCPATLLDIEIEAGAGATLGTGRVVMNADVPLPRLRVGVGLLGLMAALSEDQAAAEAFAARRGFPRLAVPA